MTRGRRHFFSSACVWPLMAALQCAIAFEGTSPTHAQIHAQTHARMRTQPDTSGRPRRHLWAVAGALPIVLQRLQNRLWLNFGVCLDEMHCRPYYVHCGTVEAIALV